MLREEYRSGVHWEIMKKNCGTHRNLHPSDRTTIFAGTAPFSCFLHRQTLLIKALYNLEKKTNIYYYMYIQIIHIRIHNYILKELENLF